MSHSWQPDPQQPSGQPNPPPAYGPVQPYSQSSAPQPYSPPPAPTYGQQPYSPPAPPQLHVHQYAAPATASPKSPGVAVILQFLIVGLGHLYTGNPIAAVIWFFSAGLAWLSIGIYIGFILVPMVYIGAMIHAYVSATNFNARHHTFR